MSSDEKTEREKSKKGEGKVGRSRGGGRRTDVIAHEEVIGVEGLAADAEDSEGALDRLDVPLLDEEFNLNSPGTYDASTRRRPIGCLRVPLLRARAEPGSLRLLPRRFRGGGHIRAVVSEENTVGPSSSGTGFYKLTYLEGNSWLWDVGGFVFLVDPILVGNLDFGFPWLYDAAKKFIQDFRLDDLPVVDCLLITQSLDDHCHLKTLKPLSERSPDLRVVSTPNAKPLLDPLFRDVTYLEPGQSIEIEGKSGSKVKVQATPGPILGPPWQRPENGYLVSAPGQLTLYYEPHCVFNKDLVGKERADIVITPVIKQLLPSFTLVSGQEDAVQLTKLLQAKFVVPMKNGDLDSKGFLASIIQSEGTIDSFQELLSREIPGAQVLRVTPGVPLEI
ncbi:hypothetical protein MLD38_003921 [Melastoma candidum]|uniref:Uncharacterized protein n=1 Tax=Melastoma candidum TaxID=119954 RepID=A0ACB9S3A9_9MYRT|nr:hypothetical protein MLD38_003921 [Melastoma candidum]